MSEMRRCDNCKTEVSETATFCPQCGQRFVSPAAPAPATEPAAPAAAAPPPPPPTYVAPASTPRRSSPWPAVLIGCGILFLLVIVLGGVAVYRSYQVAQATMATLQTETQQAPSAEGGTTGEAEGEEGAETGEEAAPAEETERRPVIVAGDGMDPNNPPRAYAVDVVPPLEGDPSGPVTTADRAAGLVIARSEVQEWLAALKQAQDEGKQRRALLTVELIPGTGNFLVHLFESVEDDEPGHTATFGWFRVNKDTGEVTNDTV